MKKQVDKDSYNFDKYIGFDRWASFYYQLKNILELKPKSVLEIGAGVGTIREYLKDNTEIIYKNLDIDEDLNPDVVGSVDNITFADNSFDLVCAFEVLEHLPLENFERSLSEIKRVAKKNVIISLPHFGPPFKFLLKIPFLREINFAFKFPLPREHQFNGEHYWEIGKRGSSPQKIRQIISKYFEIKKEFIPFENQYHHFFILEKK